MQTAKLGTLVRIIGGGTPDRSNPEYWDGDIPWVTVKDVQSSRISSSQESITEKGLRNSASNLIPAGSIIVPTRMALGKVAINQVPIAINQDLKALTVQQDSVDRDYLHRFLLSKSSYLESRGKGATVKGITLDVLTELDVPLPSLPEQHRLAAILDKADAIRRKRREALKLADEFLRAVFIDLFGDPVTNPKGWPTEKLGLLGDLQRGKSRHRPRNEPALYGGAYPFIQTGDVANCDGEVSTYSQTYSDFGLQQSRLWTKGTLCITIAANIGNTGILGFDTCFPDSVVGFKPWEKVSVEYIQYWLNGIQGELDRAASQVAQKNINLEILSALDTMLPPFSRQHRFSAIVQKVRSSKSRYKKATLEAETLFASLSHRAFQGTL